MVCVGGPLRKNSGKIFVICEGWSPFFIFLLESQKKILGKIFVMFYNRFIYSSSYNLFGMVYVGG